MNRPSKMYHFYTDPIFPVWIFWKHIFEKLQIFKLHLLKSKWKLSNSLLNPRVSWNTEDNATYFKMLFSRYVRQYNTKKEKYFFVLVTGEAKQKNHP